MDNSQATDQPSFEALFTSPLCWKSLKICQFLIDSYEYLKDDADKELRDTLILEALNLKLWHPAKNWRAILGKEHYSILAISKQPSEYKVNTKSVWHLHKIIRNKYVHTKEFTDSEKEQLGWFNKTNESWIFLPNNWVNYWTSKFPKLVPFLWMNLKSVCQSGKLTKFYPTCQNPDFLACDIYPDDFLVHMKNAVKHQINSGIVKHRYILETKSLIQCAIEFKTLPSEVIAEALDKSTSMQLLVSENRIHIKWCGLSEEERLYDIQDDFSESFGVAIANTLSDIDESFVIKQLESDSVRQLIVFTKQNKQQNHVQITSINEFMERIHKLCDVEIFQKPLTWNELNDATQKKILESAEFVFQFKDDDAERTLILRDVLTNIGDSSTEVLSSLEDSILNDLIRNKKPVIFGKQRLPIVPSYYVPRPLFREGDTNFKIKKISSDSIVLVKFTIEAFLQIEEKDPKCALRFIKFNDCLAIQLKISKDGSIFAFTDDIEQVSCINRVVDEIRKMKRESNNGDSETNCNVYCFRCLDKVGLEMISKPGFKLFLGMHKFLKERERGLSELPYGLSEQQQIIFISDKPGMGKSMVLSSLAIQAAKNFQTWNNLNVITSASKFVEQVGKSSLSENIIYTAITKFVCESAFETKLLLGLFENGLKVELFLDGLDEVKAELQTLAIEILTVVKEKMSNVRVWITTRNHMLTESVKQLSSIVYNIKPYTLDDQVTLMVNYWLNALDKCAKTATQTLRKKLSKFARKCLAGPESRLNKFLSGSPLLTIMLAEVHKEYLGTSGFAPEISTSNYISDVFDKAIDQKLAAYIGNSKENLKHTSVFHTLREHLDNSHIYFALKLILGESLANKFKKHLFVTNESSKRLEATVLEQGIILSFNPSITFIHRTFAEYFVAIFIFKILTNDYFTIHEKDPDFLEILNNHVFPGVADRIYVKRKVHHNYCKLHDFWHFFQDICLAANYQTNPNKFKILNKILEGNNDPHYLGPVFGTIKEEKCFDLVPIFLKAQEHINDLFVESTLSGHYSITKHIIENDFWNPGENPWNQFRQSYTNGYGLLHWIVKGYLHPKLSVFLTNIINYILKKDKSQLEIRDVNGNTPLMLLLKRVSTDMYNNCGLSILYQLLEHGANANVTDNHNNNVLHVVDDENEKDYDFDDGEFQHQAQTYIQQWDVLKKFDLPIQKLINAVNNEGKTPLLSAIDFFEDNLITGLFAFKIHGANFNAKDKNGNTAIHVAVKENYRFQFIEELVQCGADFGVRNAQGMNALHLAVSLDNVFLAEMLIKRLKVDVSAKDGSGKTVLDYNTSEKMKCMLTSPKNSTNEKRKKITHRISIVKPAIYYF